MIMTLKEYREKHKKCEYCKYSHKRYIGSYYPVVIGSDGYGYCEAKRKNVYLDLPRPFCRIFEAEDY